MKPTNKSSPYRLVAHIQIYFCIICSNEKISLYPDNQMVSVLLAQWGTKILFTDFLCIALEEQWSNFQISNMKWK